MTRIIRLLAVPAVGAYYYDDLTALQSRSIPLPERYTAAPATPGFRVALATRPDLIMAKPGMGVDEGITLVQNEMARILAWIRAHEK